MNVSRQPSALCCLKRLKTGPWGKSTLTAAAKHNKRTIPDRKGRIDPTRSTLNRQLIPTLPSTPAAIVSQAEELMAARGYRPPRSDSVIAVEGVFSLEVATDVPDMDSFFVDCAHWLAGRLQGDLLAADLHMDEDHPHAHVLVLLPLRRGGPPGSAALGDRDTLSRHRESFAAQVASKYGLHIPAPLSHEQRRALARSVHQQLRAHSDPVLLHPLWSVLGRAIDRNPIESAAILGIRTPSPSSLATLAASSGRGSRLQVE